MKVLLIGGTGTISMAITRLLATKVDQLYLLNRGSRKEALPDNVKTITAAFQGQNQAVFLHKFCLCIPETAEELYNHRGNAA